MPTSIASPAPPPNAHATSRAAIIRILADDLTGACDAAAPFLSAGHTVRVWLGPAATHLAQESVQSFNTASRSLDPSAAASVVLHAATVLAPDHDTLVFKKVDSAGRGPIAAEVLAAHRALHTRAILFAPSFPAAGRTVLDGILRIDDASGTSFVPLIMLFQNEALTAQITHPDQIPRAFAAGATCLVCDASSQPELEALAAIDIPDLLYAGSAGLAQALAKLHPALAPAALAPLPSISSALTICGTAHAVTQLQLEHLSDAIPHHPQLNIFTEPVNNDDILHQFERHNPEALILTGGDTALHVLTKLGASSILLRGELAPGIPWGIIQGGLADCRIVVTKSGGFGSPDALTRILKTLTASPPA